jgi:hypothetical protein
MAYTLQDSYSGGTETNSDLSTAKWWTQTITPSGDYTLTKVDLKLYRQYTDWTVTVSIKATTLGKPSGDDLAANTLATASVTTDSAGDWYSITFGAGVALTSGVTYAIVVRASGGATSDYIRWKGTNSGSYAGGNGGYSADSGSTWTMYDAVDMGFKTYSGSTITYTDLAGTIPLALSLTGTMTLTTYSDLAGTIAMTLSLTGTLDRKYIAAGRIIGKIRVVACGSDALYYEDT